MSTNDLKEPKVSGLDRNRWGWLVLFGASTTLVCCALPIVLVALGMGSVVAALFANVPLLSVLAGSKIWLFAVSFGLLVLAAWALFRPGRACPTDPRLAQQCDRAYSWNKRLWWLSALVWGLGFFAAYALLPISELLFD